MSKKPRKKKTPAPKKDTAKETLPISRSRSSGTFHTIESLEKRFLANPALSLLVFQSQNPQVAGELAHVLANHFTLKPVRGADKKAIGLRLETDENKPYFQEHFGETLFWATVANPQRAYGRAILQSAHACAENSALQRMPQWPHCSRALNRLMLANRTGNRENIQEAVAALHSIERDGTPALESLYLLIDELCSGPATMDAYYLTDQLLRIPSSQQGVESLMNRFITWMDHDLRHGQPRAGHGSWKADLPTTYVHAMRHHPAERVETWLARRLAQVCIVLRHNTSAEVNRHINIWKEDRAAQGIEPGPKWPADPLPLFTPEEFSPA